MYHGDLGVLAPHAHPVTGVSCPRTISRGSAARPPPASSTVSAARVTSPFAACSASTGTSASSTARPARPAPPSARAPRSSAPGWPLNRPYRSSNTSPRATASARPSGSPACIVTPSCGWHAWPVSMPTTPTTSWWPFPPETREVQLDEKWSFVAKKQANCDPLDPSDDHKGDWWDHVAYDAEHRLVLAVVPGARSIENAEEAVQEVHDRTAGRTDVLLTSDVHPAYATAIGHVYGEPEPPKPPGTPGRRPVLPPRRPPPDLTYATVHKEREKGRVVAIALAVVLGTWQAVVAALKRSGASRTVNTSFVERHHGTDRG